MDNMLLAQHCRCKYSLWQQYHLYFVPPLLEAVKYVTPDLFDDLSQTQKWQQNEYVLFDVDGTLADSWRLGFDATQVVLERNDVPAIDEAAYHDGTRYCTPERLARHAGLDPADPPFAEVGARLAAEFDDLYVGLVSTETAGFFAGIDDLLEGVVEPSSERARVGVLTNACIAYAARVLEVNLGDGVDTFSSVRGADNVPAPKPAADGLLRCCEDLGLRPDECVYVGDSPSDARAAEAAG